MSHAYPYYRREVGEMYRPPAAAPALRPGELFDIAERLGYWEREPVASVPPLAFTPPFEGRRSMLTACILAALGKRNRIAQADALFSVADAIGDATSESWGEGRQPAILAAADNLNAAHRHWLAEYGLGA